MGKSQPSILAQAAMIAIVDDNRHFAASLKKGILAALPSLKDCRLITSDQYPTEQDISKFFLSRCTDLKAIILNMHIIRSKNDGRRAINGLEVYDQVLGMSPSYKIVLVSFESLDRLRQKELGWLLAPQYYSLFKFCRLPFCIEDIVNAIK